MKSTTKSVAGWGNFPRIKSSVYRPESLSNLQRIIVATKHVIPFGNNMSYGDASLGETSIDMKRLNKFLSFDTAKGILKAEAGVLLSDILEIAVPHGWFLVTTPGTKFVTLGGCVASDVHGKNHHVVGSFKQCVRSFDIVLASGELVHCSRNQHADLFEATLGGMGLTGAVYSVEIQLKKIRSSDIMVEHHKYKDFNSILAALEEDDSKFEYTVAWIDTLAKGKNVGRGIMMLGTNATTGPLVVHSKRKIPVPFYFPSFALNSLTLRIFNAVYYHIHNNFKGRQHYDTFFYPLDGIHGWNKTYGKRGFIQYQFVAPSTKAVREILETVSSNGMGGFLAVLKKLKNEKSLISFPQGGYTLAMDFPARKSVLRNIPLLDAIVAKYGGRLYLTKDALMKKDLFYKGYPHIQEWKKIKKKYDPMSKFTSLQAQRLGLA